MRICALALLMLLAGCTAADRPAPVEADEPEPKWDWPFEPPAWAQPVSESDTATAAADQRTVILSCEFANAGSFAVQLVGLLGVTPERGVVLDAEPVQGLRRMIGDVEDASIVSAPKVVTHVAQGAWASVLGSEEGRRVFFKCSEVDLRKVSVRFAADVAQRTEGGEWDIERSWRIEGEEVLEIGQAIISDGGVAEDGNPLLVITQLLDIRPAEKERS